MALLLALFLLAGEGSVLGASLLMPGASAQYRALFIDRSRTCWLSPQEIAADRADPLMAGLPRIIRPELLDHRERCGLLPLGWGIGTHRTEDGVVFTRAMVARIALPMAPGETEVTLMIQGYAPPGIESRVDRVEVQPEVDGRASPSVSLRRGDFMALRLSVPPQRHARLVTIRLTLPQPPAVRPFNLSDNARYAGIALWSIARE